MARPQLLPQAAVSAKKTLDDLAAKLRKSADTYRSLGDKQDRAACSIEFLAEQDEDVAAKALELVMKQYPRWFPS